MNDMWAEGKVQYWLIYMYFDVDFKTLHSK